VGTRAGRPRLRRGQARVSRSDGAPSGRRGRGSAGGVRERRWGSARAGGGSACGRAGPGADGNSPSGGALGGSAGVGSAGAGALQAGPRQAARRWAEQACAARSAEVEQQHWASAGMRLQLGVGARDAGTGVCGHWRGVSAGAGQEQALERRARASGARAGATAGAAAGAHGRWRGSWRRRRARAEGVLVEDFCARCRNTMASTLTTPR
jgi:hypothetical protein